MSWGYYLDLELSLPTAEWTRLQSTKGGVLPAKWWGFKNADLEDLYGGLDDYDDVTFKKVFTFWTDGKSAAKSVTESKGTTTVKLTVVIDRGGDTQVVKPVAAFFDAAAAVGSGRIRLVNDGSASGENGVEVTIADGVLVRSKVVDRELRDTLFARVYPDLAATVDKLTSRPAKKAAKKPSAKKPARKPVAKKSKKR